MTLFSDNSNIKERELRERNKKLWKLWKLYIKNNKPNIKYN